MTCIVGIKTEKAIWIGGDSAGVWSYDVTSRADTKVWKKGEFIYGFCGSFRMGQLLRHAFDPPPNEDEDLERYMVIDFVNEARRCFKEGGYLRVSKRREEGGEFLVGYRGRLFCVQSDFQVAEARQGYMALGCGESYALGSLYTTDLFEMKPRSRINLALHCANNFSGGVCEPFVIEKLKCG